MSVVAARALSLRQRGEGTKINPRTHLGEGHRKLPLTPTLSPPERVEDARKRAYGGARERTEYVARGGRGGIGSAGGRQPGGLR